MTKRTRKTLVIGLSVLAGFGGTFLNYKERRSFRCQVCHSQKHSHQWRIGSWADFSLPLTGKWEQVEESHFCKDFFPPNHTHDWLFAQGSPYYLFGTAWQGCALGAGRYANELLRIYEIDPEFRNYLRRALADNTLVRSNIVALIADTARGEADKRRDERDSLLNSYFQASK